VPEISRFFGIVVRMHLREHEPAHFHAWYGGKEMIVRIDDGQISGRVPPRIRWLVLEWWSLHREELAENWQLVRALKEPKPIPPLE
jgi:hypothetical protein